MILLFAIRAACGISFYFIWAQYVSFILRVTFSPWLAALVYVTAATLGYAVRERGRLWRVMPMSLFALYAPMSASWTDAAFMAPIVAYALYATARGRYETNYDSFRRVFTRQSIALVPLGIFIFLFGGVFAKGSFDAAIGFAIVFFVSAATVLRSLRHGGHMARDRVFQSINVASAAVVVIVGVLSSYPAIRLSFVSLFYGEADMRNYTVYDPTLSATPATVTPEPLYMTIEPPDESENAELIVPSPSEYPYDITTAEKTSVRPFVALITLFIAASAFVFRYLLTSRASVYSGGFVRERISAEDKPRRERPTGKVGSIRRRYIRFLKLCRSRGLVISPRHTAADISEWASERPECAERDLREEYEGARYGARHGENIS